MKRLKDIANWYFSRKALPYWGVFLIDCLCVYLSALLIYSLNYGLSTATANFGSLCSILGIYLIFYIVGFRIFHTYSGVIRYSTLVDLQRVATAVLLGFVLSMIVRQVFDLNETMLPIRMRDMMIWSGLAILEMWSFRLIVKYIYDTLFRNRGAKQVFVYGIREGGMSIAHSILLQEPAEYILKGFVTDEETVVGKMLMGVKVYRNDSMLVHTMVSKQVSALFVSPLRIETLRNNTQMVNALIDAGIKIYVLPTEREWSGESMAEAGVDAMREIDIEDLLPRDKIEVDMDKIGENIDGRSIMITGAAGSIGSEIVRQVAQFSPTELILIDQAETPLHDIRLMMQREFPEVPTHTIVADIANMPRMEYIFAKYKPYYVFHAAAYKHVPMMENNPCESIQNNVEGTRIIADLAVKYGCRKFIMVSTDKAVNPTNVMGCSKRICEIYVQSLDKAIKDGVVKGVTRFVTTRFGNVLGSNGSVIPLFKEQIRKGGPVTVTHPDIIRYFMLIPEACRLVLEAATMGHGGEIYVFDMGQPIKIVDLAKRMIHLSGADIDIQFIGLRDGEKLYEEVLSDEEKSLPTHHEKIKIARVREYDYELVKADIANLVAASRNEGPFEVVKRMKAIVPEYISQHSPYEVLDNKPNLQTLQ